MSTKEALCMTLTEYAELKSEAAARLSGWMAEVQIAYQAVDQHAIDSIQTIQNKVQQWIDAEGLNGMPFADFDELLQLAVPDDLLSEYSLK